MIWNNFSVVNKKLRVASKYDKLRLKGTTDVNAVWKCQDSKKYTNNNNSKKEE